MLSAPALLANEKKRLTEGDERKEIKSNRRIQPMIAMHIVVWCYIIISCMMTSSISMGIGTGVLIVLMSAARPVVYLYTIMSDRNKIEGEKRRRMILSRL